MNFHGGLDGAFHLLADGGADPLGLPGDIHLHIGDAVFVKGHGDGNVADLALCHRAVGAGGVDPVRLGLGRKAETEQRRAGRGCEGTLQKLPTTYFIGHPDHSCK